MKTFIRLYVLNKTVQKFFHAIPGNVFNIKNTFSRRMKTTLIVILVHLEKTSRPWLK